MKTWPLQDVQARYAEFVDDYLSVGPQPMTGLSFKAPDTGVAAPKLEQMASRPTLKALLLTDFARTEHLVPA